MPDNEQPETSDAKFLTLEEVLEIHETLLREFGGPPGVRDLGLLESALFRPRTGYYQDLIEMTAALFESLLMNRAFVDGNKRVAFFSVDILLRINGYRIAVDSDVAHRKIFKIIEQRTHENESLARLLRQYTVEI